MWGTNIQKETNREMYLIIVVMEGRIFFGKNKQACPFIREISVDN